MEDEIFILGACYASQMRKYVNEEIDSHPLWISRYIKTNPKAIRQIYRDFLNAGSDIIDSLTYQASIPGYMESFGLDEASSYELFKECVRNARCAVEEHMKENPNSKRPLIAGGVGSYGAYLHDGSEYTGSFVDKVDMSVVMEWHKPRIRALVEEGVDLIAFETIPAKAEAEVLLRIMREYPNQRFWLSFQCKDNQHTAFGDNFKMAVKECFQLAGSQVAAVGCNCLNPNFVDPLLSGINNPGKVVYPLVVYPNSGEDFTAVKGWHGSEKWDNFDAKVAKWLDLGVRYLGSCCRTDISFIRRLKEVVQRWRTQTN